MNIDIIEEILINIKVSCYCLSVLKDNLAHLWSVGMKMEVTTIDIDCSDCFLDILMQKMT